LLPSGAGTDDPAVTPTPSPSPRTITFRLSELFLALVAFGGLVVGIPLVLGLLSMPELVDSDDWMVPVAFLGYGVLSAVAFVAERQRRAWAIAAVLISQVPWMVGMAWAYVAFADDWSLLLTMALAAAAVVTAVLERVRR
jgi:hypothetical protein